MPQHLYPADIAYAYCVAALVIASVALIVEVLPPAADALLRWIDARRRNQ